MLSMTFLAEGAGVSTPRVIPCTCSFWTLALSFPQKNHNYVLPMPVLSHFYLYPLFKLHWGPQYLSA